MASISTDKNGNRTIQFVAGDNKRRTIRLGKVPMRTAETVKTRIEHLNAASIAGHAIDGDTAKWLADIEDSLAGKLAAVGLSPNRERQSITLGQHLNNYLAKRTDVKARTHTRWGQAKSSLLAFFSADRQLTSISAGEAKDWERWLKSGLARKNRYGSKKADEGLAPNTVRKRISDAKQFFEDAVSRDLLIKNPFAGLRGTAGSNRERDYFIDRTEAQKVLDACPDAQWRLLFALSRYGGLRCPSEHLALTWGDIDWEHGRMRVPSPKTEHHEGKDERIVPIFAELRPYLDEAWHQLDDGTPGTEPVITRYRDANSNLRTHLERIIRKAGLEVWPKLWQNLRASRATELAAEHPAHVAAAWLGHSTVVANKHYWQVTESDFNKAINASASALQNPVQQMLEHDGTNVSVPSESQQNAPLTPGLFAPCIHVQFLPEALSGILASLGPLKFRRRPVGREGKTLEYPCGTEY